MKFCNITSFFSLDFDLVLVYSFESQASTFFYFTQQGVCLSKLDVLAKLTFGCILERRRYPSTQPSMSAPS